MKILCCYLSLILALGSASQSAASDHLVPPTEFRAALISQSDEREANLAEIRTLLSDEAVREQLEGIANLGKIEASIANLGRNATGTRRSGSTAQRRRQRYRQDRDRDHSRRRHHRWQRPAQSNPPRVILNDGPQLAVFPPSML